MEESKIRYSVFSKPWRMPLPELGALVTRLGFDGIELPVRPGYQVPPEQVHELPKAAKQLATHGVRIYSVAGPADEATIAACGEAGVPTLRVMVRIGDESYTEAVERTWREFDALLPLLEKHGVQLGVQNHCDRFVPNALGLRQLLEPYDPRHIAAVWDAAHEALAGMDPDLALDVIWPQLCMVNLKNGLWLRQNGPEADYAEWKHNWTGARHGLCSWLRVTAELKRRGYAGVVCLTAEYSDGGLVDRLIAEDIAIAKALLA